MPFWPFKRTQAKPDLAVGEAVVSVSRHADDTGITFAVDDVTPATEALPLAPMHEVVREALGGPLESCSDYHGQVVSAGTGHALVHTVHLAFSEHRPLILGPDAVWLTIAQGVAHHVHNHAESLRDRLVDHAGKETLRVVRDDFVAGTPENPWPEVFSAFSEQIQERARVDAYELMVPTFSTTGPVETAAFEVVLMDMFAPFFDYALYCICGIPQVTLRGTAADWAAIEERVERLDALDLQHWTEQLRPICRQLRQTAEGQVDVGFWRGIYKPRDQYGPSAITGWINRLFPYLKDNVTGRATRPNPVLTSEEGRAQGIVPDSLPQGLAEVPFTMLDAKQERAMAFVAGLTGVRQADDLSLEPAIGWAVRELPGISQSLNRLAKAGALRPSAGAEAVGKALGSLGASGTVPAALIAVYLGSDGGPVGDTELRAIADLELVCYDGTRFNRVALDGPRTLADYQGHYVNWLILADQGSHCLAYELDHRGGQRILRFDPTQLGDHAPADVVAPSLEAALDAIAAGEPLESQGSWLEPAER